MTLPVFVAGPILGGDDWQANYISSFMECLKSDSPITLYQKIEPRLLFIVPCRWGDDHPLAQYFVQKYIIDDYHDDAVRESQTFWECHYLDQIIVPESPGMVVFGLFPESKEHPRTDGNPYGRDTLGELGRWPTIGRFRGAENIYIGMHSDWSGGEVFKKNETFWPKKQSAVHIRNISDPYLLARWSAQCLIEKCLQR